MTDAMRKQSTNKNIFALIARLFSLIKAYKKYVWLSFFSIVVLAILSPLRPYIIGHMVDSYIVKSQDAEMLLVWVLVVFSSLLVEAIAQVSSTYFSNLLAQNLIVDLRKRLFKKIARLNITFFDKNPVGSLVTRTVSDMQAITEVFSSGLVDIIGDLLALFLILVFMFFTNWELAFMTLIPIPLLLLATKIFANTMKKAFQKERAAVTSLNNFVNERLTGMSLIQLFNRQNQEYIRFEKINHDHKQAHIQTILANSIFFPVVELLSSLSIAFILVWGAIHVSGKNNVEIKTMYGEIIAFTLWISQLYRPIRQLADKFNILQRGAVRAERVFELLDLENEEEENYEGLKNIDFQQDIYFKEVYFSYNKKEPLFEKLNLVIEQGKTCAIVGSTGSGKTSLINLLSRFYKVDQGEICIGKTPINQIETKELNAKIGVVLQDVFLFSGSIKENILLGDTNIRQEHVLEAAKKVGVHEFIMSLPNNYDYVIGERGLDLSVGQRQLISFLRAYIHNPEILILDEATSSIDSETETLIQKALEKLTKGRTSIIIAHRLATIKKADKIIVMDNGVITETGTHEELLALKKVYYGLHEKQFNLDNL